MCFAKNSGTWASGLSFNDNDSKVDIFPIDSGISVSIFPWSLRIFSLECAPIGSGNLTSLFRETSSDLKATSELNDSGKTAM